MLKNCSLVALMLASSIALAAPPLPPSNFKFGPPTPSKIYPAVDPSLYPVVVSADSSVVIRDKAPLDLFGFNIVWSKFQHGYWRNGKVRPEVIEWLKPFRGALYRYPGGTDSNYFLWEDSVGNIGSRAKQQDKHKVWVKAEFGFDEYIEFVKAIGGRPIVVANLNGKHDVKWTPQQAAEYNRKWIEYANKGAKNVTGQVACEIGAPCPVTLWELGNELDWEEKWTAEKYVSTVKVVAPALRATDPAVDLLAHMKTAPWQDKAATTKFNTTVGQLRDLVDNYAVHPYYDGVSVSNIEKAYIDETIVKTVKDPGSKVFITEHALWPYRAPGATLTEWQKTWSTTGDMGGALASADFVLMTMNRPDIGGAIWHALGLAGPWHLFYVNSSNDQAYPNVVYWGLCALREGVLDHVVKSSVKAPFKSGYTGGYDVRSAVMKNTLGTKYSVLAINRGGSKQPMAVNIPDFANSEVKITTRTVSASGMRVGNTHAEPNKVKQVVSDTTSQFGSNGVMALELPPYAVISFVIERQ